LLNIVKKMPIIWLSRKYMSYNEIAKKFNLSKSTIYKYVNFIKLKKNVNN